MSEIEIISEKLAWDTLVNLFDSSDFYHTYDYHDISKNETESPIIIKFSEGDVLIALPLMIRKIEGTDYQDATSIYGYGGPLSKTIGGNFNNSNFIKTSTGKEPVNATLPVSLTMIRAIRDYHQRTGHYVGYKPAGGISKAKDALVNLSLLH